MKKLIYTLLTFSIAFMACKSNLQPESKEKIALKYYDTKGFFISEIEHLKNTPYFIYKIISKQNGTTDSSIVNFENFEKEAAPFLAVDITQDKTNYTESTFKDLSTKSVNINYTANNKALPIQNIDILLADDSYTVKRIFIKKVTDTTVTQLSWKANKSFTIINTTNNLTTTEFVNWNDK